MLQPTTPEQRAGIYVDVQEMLIPGFLSATVRINDVVIALRSPSAADFYLLNNRLGNDPMATEQQYKSWTIATCTWMIDGQVIIGHQGASKHVYNMIFELPRYALSVLFYQVFGLLSRARRTIEYIEAYSYEMSSRALWRQIGTSFEEVSGIPGIETTGRNVVQQIWSAQNEAEDERIQQLNDWERAKMIAAPHAYKAIKRMNQTEEVRQMEEEQRRQEVMDRAYYRFKGYKMSEKEPIAGNGLRFRSKSRDELAEEYKAWVRGEQDFHDQVVTDYKRKIREGMRNEIEAIQRQQEEFDREVSQLQLPASAPQVVGYSASQVREILTQRGGGRLAQQRQVLPDGKRFRNYNRFIKPDEKPSNFTAGEVFRSEGNTQDLNRRIAQRRPQLNDHGNPHEQPQPPPGRKVT